MESRLYGVEFRPAQKCGGRRVDWHATDIGRRRRKAQDAAAYRADVTPPADVIVSNAFTTAPWQTGTDIGGKKVDINTSPVSIPIDQTIVTITWVIRFPYLDWDGDWVGTDGAARTISLDQIAEDFVGGRNTTEFMGFPIGSMLMESVEFQPLHHEFKTAVMTIIYDEWHHAQEMPLVNPQFNIRRRPTPPRR